MPFWIFVIFVRNLVPVRKEYIREYMREYRKKNLLQMRATSRERYYRKKAILTALKDKPCADCGIKYPSYVMDFDHVRGEKKFFIHKSMAHALQVLLDEVAKCDVVCANCHRERTFRRKQWSRRKETNDICVSNRVA